MKKHIIPNTRLGGTSFIIHADYVSGVRYAKERCDDIALLLTCVGEKGEWLPTKEEIKEIKRIIEGEGITLHVHLPTDGECSTEQNTKAYCQKILMAIERVSFLNVHTFVQHIDIIELRSMNTLPSLEQQEYIRQMLSTIAKHIENPNMLALENLETFPLNFIDFCFHNTEYSRCLDIGHLWKEGRDPALIIPTWLDKIRLVHLHGLKPKHLFQTQDAIYKKILPTGATIRHLYGKKVCDHKSLDNIPHAWIDKALHPLWKNNYNGVINLEVFNTDDFNASYHAVLQSYKRFESCRTI